MKVKMQAMSEATAELVPVPGTTLRSNRNRTLVRNLCVLMAAVGSARAHAQVNLEIPVVMGVVQPSMTVNDAIQLPSVAFECQQGDPGIVVQVDFPGRGQEHHFGYQEGYDSHNTYWAGWNQEMIYTVLPYAIVRTFRVSYSSLAGGALGPCHIQVSKGGVPIVDVMGLVDPRSQAERDGAPKLNLTDNNGYMKFGISPGAGGRIIAGGKINDPGFPINPFGLTLEFDENGVRRSVPVLVGPDGRFSIDQRFLVGSSGISGRPLLLYHRTGGNNINVSYFGNGTEVQKTNEIKGYQFDSVRNKIDEYIKTHGQFPRRVNPPATTMGVRG